MLIINYLYDYYIIIKQQTKSNWYIDRLIWSYPMDKFETQRRSPPLPGSEFIIKHCIYLSTRK